MTMQGLVFKLSDWRKNWNERYFELVRPEQEGGPFVLRYRRHKGDDVMPSLIEMDAEAVRISDVNEEPETLSGGKQIYRWSVVSVKLSGLRFDLASPSLATSRLWVQKLRRCMGVGAEDDEEDAGRGMEGGKEEDEKDKEADKEEAQAYGEQEERGGEDRQQEGRRRTSRSSRARTTSVPQEKEGNVETDTKVRTAFHEKRRSAAQALRQQRIPPTILEDGGRVRSSPEQKSGLRIRKRTSTSKRRDRTESYSTGIPSAPKFGGSSAHSMMLKIKRGRGFGGEE